MARIEQEVQIEGRYTLAGTLALPSEAKEKFPVIIMVHGTGEIDRNENAKRMKTNVFQEMSDLALDHGFATLRYDKRGIGKSDGNYMETGLWDLIDDATETVRFAAAHPSIDKDRIILLGHSEGCLIVPAVYQRRSVQGVILLAGPAEPLAETTGWQRESIKEDMRRATGFEGFVLRMLKMEGKLEKMNSQLLEKVTSTTDPVIRYKGKKINAKWNREHGDFDVRKYLPQITCPVLAVTGSKDVQVKPEDTARVCSLTSGRCESEIIPDLTHLLRKTDKDNKIRIILKDYKNQVKKPVDQELNDWISSWLTAWKQGEL